MRRLSLMIVAALWATGCALAAADPAPSDPPARPDIVDRYVSAVQAQKTNAQSVSMAVDIDAELPRLKKHGRLHALRFVSKLGSIRYIMSSFDGDNTIKKEVIGRYLEAEKEAGKNYSASIGITPENYKFKYKGIQDYLDHKAYVFHLSPRKKRVGLFKGELWVDAQTFLPLRELGEFVKSPSVFLKSVYFVRDYYIYNGRAIPRRVISEVETRIVGPAQITIWFDDFRTGSMAEVAAGGSAPAAATDN